MRHREVASSDELRALTQQPPWKPNGGVAMEPGECYLPTGEAGRLDTVSIVDRGLRTPRWAALPAGDLRPPKLKSEKKERED
jgi:hypothetical protein